MRTCLVPFFIGRHEPGLDIAGPRFDTMLPAHLIDGYDAPADAITAANRMIRSFVQETVREGGQPFVLSGDCVSTIGCLAGLQAAGVVSHLIWMDAHGDFHTPDTTISGHLGGMPLAMITGRGDATLLTRVGLDPLPDERACHVGARDLEPGEVGLLQASKVAMVEDSVGAIASIPRDSPVWVHLDTDYINPIDAPAMRYPAAGGPRASHVRRELERLAEDLSIVGMSVSAWAPHLDRDGTTARSCWDAIGGLLKA